MKLNKYDSHVVIGRSKDGVDGTANSLEQEFKDKIESRFSYESIYKQYDIVKSFENKFKEN